MPYRIPGEVDGEDYPEDIIDPLDPASLTLDVAISNPSGYAARFALLSEEKQAAWLGRVSVESLRTHFAAMRTGELHVALQIRDAEMVADGFAHPRSAVTFVKAASLATQTARLARAVGLPFVLDVDAVLSEIWNIGAIARRRSVPDLEPHALRLRVVENISVTVELQWSSAALGGARKWAVLAIESTTEATHEADVDRAVARARALGRELGVGVSVL